MTDTPPHKVDEKRMRRLVDELSRERPEATAEENLLLAETQLRAAAEAERSADRMAREDAANLMARLEMDVYGHP